MNAPLISVVVPNYNYARFLPQAVRSVADQTYPRTELVVVDDGSADDSLSVLDDLQSRLRNRFSDGFHILSGTGNMGAHAALNTGIAQAKGEYIAILNADDLFEADRLETMHDALSKTGAQLAFSDVRCIGPGGEAIDDEFARKMRALPKSTQKHPFVAAAAAAENVAVSTGNMLMTKSLHEKLGGFRSYRYVHDYDFLLRASLASEPVYVPGTDYLYRIHGDNSFTKLQKIGIAENRLVWLETYERIKHGEVSNETILCTPRYKEILHAAAGAYGFQKKAVWLIAGTPAGSAVAALMRSKLRRFRGQE